MKKTILLTFLLFICLFGLSNQILAFVNDNGLTSPLVKQEYQPQKRNHIFYYHFDLKPLKIRKLKNIADTLIGDWYGIDSSGYNEFLFINDSIFGYSSVMGISPLLHYVVENKSLIITEPNRQKVHLTIKTIDLNTLRLYGKDTIKSVGMKSEINDIKIELHRIPDSEFKFSDIKCWGETEKKNGKTQYTKDEKKYIKAFVKRRRKAYK